MADPTRIHQIIMNLCTNAWHAMEEGGGVLRIVVENTVITTDDPTCHPDLTSGQYVCLHVADTGHGRRNA
ncbi:MAG: hypothetical protein KJ737_01115 [Proteobacteria bacterium]|nr:hypothetical protein [Pseudomonadota bacterium]